MAWACAVPRSVACLHVMSLSRFNRAERGWEGGDALPREEEEEGGLSVFALVLEGPGGATNTMGKLSSLGSAIATG